MKEDIIEYIDGQRQVYPQLRHANNIFVKWSDKKITKRQTEVLIEVVQKYYIYLKGNLELKGFSNDIIKKRVKLLNDYYNFFYDNEYDNVFSSQGKFRSTILEEFMFLLFKDYIEHLKKEYNDINDVLNSGAAKSYTNLYFTSPNFRSFIESPDIEINLKDQDFAIYRDFDLKINEKKSWNLF